MSLSKTYDPSIVEDKWQGKCRMTKSPCPDNLRVTTDVLVL